MRGSAMDRTTDGAFSDELARALHDEDCGCGDYDETEDPRYINAVRAVLARRFDKEKGHMHDRIEGFTPDDEGRAVTYLRYGTERVWGQLVQVHSETSGSARWDRDTFLTPVTLTPASTLEWGHSQGPDA